MIKSFTGSIFLIAGTIIGAGMLAIPILSLTLGFTLGSLSLILIWFITTYSACLMVVLIRDQKKPVSLAQLAEQTLGTTGKGIALISLCLMHISLLSAYAAGGASLGMKLFPSANESSLQIGFLTLLALLVSTTPRISDIANRGFFFLKLCFFAILFYSLFPAATLDNLWNEPSTTLPLNTFIIFFTSFGFHGSIPVFVEYMNHQSTKRIKTAFWIGSTLPLLAYLGWQTISLAALSPLQKLSVENNPENLGFFIEQLHQVTSNASLNFFITGFSLLAIITSFIGVGLGHFQLIKEQLSLTKIPTNRLLLIILTFGVPLFICLFYPKAFLAALQFAGITLCLIAIVLPTLISWKLKRHSKIVLSLLLLISTIIIGTELQRWL